MAEVKNPQFSTEATDRFVFEFMSSDAYKIAKCSDIRKGIFPEGVDAGDTRVKLIKTICIEQDWS